MTRQLLIFLSGYAAGIVTAILATVFIARKALSARDEFICPNLDEENL